MNPTNSIHSRQERIAGYWTDGIIIGLKLTVLAAVLTIALNVPLLITKFTGNITRAHSIEWKLANAFRVDPGN